MRCSGRTVLSRDSRPGVAVFDLVLVLDQDQVRVRTLTRRPAGLAPTQRLTSQQTVHLELCSVDSFSTVIVNVETCSDCGKRILLCIPFLISIIIFLMQFRFSPFFICQLFYSVPKL